MDSVRTALDLRAAKRELTMETKRIGEALDAGKVQSLSSDNPQNLMKRWGVSEQVASEIQELEDKIRTAEAKSGATLLGC